MASPASALRPLAVCGHPRTSPLMRGDIVKAIEIYPAAGMPRWRTHVCHKGGWRHTGHGPHGGCRPIGPGHGVHRVVLLVLLAGREGWQEIRGESGEYGGV